MVAGYYDTSYPPSLWAPAPPPAPILASIAPTTAVINTPITITATGSNFVNGDVIRTGGTPRPTTFVSATSLTATYTTPATAQTVQVTVNGANGTTGSRPLTVTATVEEEPSSEPVAEEPSA